MKVKLAVLGSCSYKRQTNELSINELENEKMCFYIQATLESSRKKRACCMDQ